MTFFKTLFLIGVVASETIRFPHRRRNRLEWRRGAVATARFRARDVALDVLAFAGMEILPRAPSFGSLSFVFSK